ncbi:hypothetical protein HY642_06270 [Candidatus Woesearchaeota archaeon]|nr:hypothetical protein [Candidatus Woesearchaeota archaeon]
MIELTARAKEWGNSVGIVVPKKLGIRPGQELRIHIEPAREFTKVREVFGTLRLKRPVRALMAAIDSELDSD